VRIQETQRAGERPIDVVGALHGELQPLASIGVLAPLDDVANKLKGRGISDALLTLGRLGTAQ